MKIADQLRALRTEAGLSQEQLAEKAKLSRYSIYRYEAGFDVPVTTFARICAALNVDAGEVLSRAVNGGK
jgi:transcriptional regulator with XRE-family HTH domain